ncbi:hypothetical protein P152DRAFT_185202 [Eremomyces bilateralis CBS 781.70]|uniref:SH3 domain-containing protein n=1 Tax=Eremomyces bilateralis CBS 781.70 TaxID=1392243 RepID=A0A6G1GBG7_9PEZI|nr:uncharacterized protein P152DRAFT_185202 [Eremomyces bilateralis CBS 781.70]KAF1815425.1 hypothetical protein P152DRAFT_185202 [Eremomyces bilateralis CBS 781.70]
MTRPHIIRADTIDLQDHIFPSAQDHSRQAQNPASQGIGQTAPHQAAAVRHMQEERHSEEEQLSHAWNPTDGNLHNEPPSDDEHVLFENGVHDQHQVYQRDDSAIQQNGGHSGSHEEEPGDADADDGMDDDMMDKISSSPSIDDEDIDFEFVYALHTFVATVEGQANATKGDTMVLLDDSNSYWWLVRVVKDNSIGRSRPFQGV